MDSNMILIAAVAIVIFLFAKNKTDEAARKKKLIHDLRENYGKDEIREYTPVEYELISHHFKNKGAAEGEDIIDQITWDDLDMDNFFMSMNHTLSETGEEYLFDMLHRPVMDAEILKERGRVIEFFDQHEKERLLAQQAFAAMGHPKKYSLSDYLKQLDNLREENNVGHMFCAALGIVSIAMIFLKPPVGFVMVLLATAVNVATYFKRKGETDPYVRCFSYIVRMLRETRALLALDAPELSEYIERLRKAQDTLKELNHGMFLLMSGRNLTGSIMELPLDYIRIFFHLDLMRFNVMLRIVRKNRDAIDELIEIAGFLDSMISVGHFRRTLLTTSEPEFISDETVFSAEDMFHPLLKKPVPATIEARRGVLVTGSNASGKSTFLKSAALTALLAETIYTVPAKHVCMSFFKIYSSMSIRDSISAGDSYYMAEIRAMKRIMDAVKTRAGASILCFVDEVLRGTNTVERIAASSQLLKSLSTEGVICFAATHDIELTHMLENYIDNYHFSETAGEGTITFSYRLEPGRAESRDAIRLLDMIGYDQSITKAAFETSSCFMETGAWPKL
ncbi:MAG: hypothetical protein K6F39_04750 [Lachnospiraceae bacterium]|nr:hypothetical protein [Lachnospiraceae bacterium]